MQIISNTLTTIPRNNNVNYYALRLRDNENRQNSQIGIQPLRLRKREHSEISNPNEDKTRNTLTQEQVKFLRLNKLGGSSQRPKLTSEQKKELEQAYKEYKDKLMLRQTFNHGPTPLQIKIINLEKERTESLGIVRNKQREQDLVNVIDQQPLELSLAQLRSLLRIRNNVPINENLIPNEGQIRQNIPEPINLLDESQIRTLIIYIMEEQNERSRQEENYSSEIPAEELQEPLEPFIFDFPIIGAYIYL